MVQLVHRHSFRWTLLTLAIIGANTASADAINFTGFVENDFSKSNPNVATVNVDSDPLNSIFQPSGMTSAGLINGYATKDIRFSYDSKTDTMYVGVNTYSIAGSAVGAGGPAWQQTLAGMGGSDPASLGGDKSITVGFAANNPNSSGTAGALIAVAGVPADKSTANPAGLDKFTVASYAGAANQGIQYNYGSILTNNQGVLAFDPSASHPGFEFTINNFSKISPALDPTQGFWIQVYAGSAQDGPIGEESSGFLHVPAFSQQNVPEPATWLAWSLIAGGAATRLRRRGKK